MKKYRKFNNLFQIRWKEPMGLKDCPYLYRWTLILFGFTFRIHHWIKSDDRRFYHDHACDLISILLVNGYKNVYPNEEGVKIESPVKASPIYRTVFEFTRLLYRKFVKKLSVAEVNKDNTSVWFAKAEQRHYLDIPKGGAWTLLLQSKPRIKWGFFVPRKDNGVVRKMRPLRYFSRYGIIQTEDYQ